MKKIKNALFSFLNVLVIAGILLFILAGLVKIGIFEAPSFMKEIFGESQNGDSEQLGSASDVLEHSAEAKDYTVYSAKLNSESVKKLLSGLKPAKQFSHDIQYSVISAHSTGTKRIFVINKDNIQCAFYLSADGAVEKQIIRNEGFTSINTLKGDKLHSTAYSNGDIDFSEQTGVILTHKDFLSAADEPGYTFAVQSDDMGTVMLIEFTSVMGEYAQLQKYTLNLDYGVVTEAKCYENDKLIYELSTNAISGELTPSFAVPAEFTSNLPNGFVVFDSASSEN